jgi:hypothetical protein
LVINISYLTVMVFPLVGPLLVIRYVYYQQRIHKGKKSLQ